MLLKKQTVWLLTMLSLVVVLSVYYITSPEQQMNNMATVEKESEEDSTVSGEKTSESGETVISSTASDEMFEALRLELDEERSKLKEELETTVASTDLPTEDINAALDKIKELNDVTQKEAYLETMIVAMDYEDALVRVSEDEVRVTVKAKSHSPAAANEILKLVRSELGGLKPVVQFQISK
jgi:stage III sporulation protein AH